ncbi:MAG TPA: hypothetical protein VKA81_00595, partial [Verrucomicrobiae bacterium]|nr:hypothetical protein [Verrucomicrobiae bacterium]
CAAAIHEAGHAVGHRDPRQTRAGGRRAKTHLPKTHPGMTAAKTRERRKIYFLFAPFVPFSE